VELVGHIKFKRKVWYYSVCKIGGRGLFPFIIPAFFITSSYSVAAILQKNMPSRVWRLWVQQRETLYRIFYLILILFG
jgi:hypothetical protein